MQEKRKAKRLVLDAHLIMNRIDSGKHDLIPVSIVDISKNGVGFTCNQLLEMGSVYEAELTIWTKEVIHTFVNIIRFDNSGDENVYGGTFVGLTEHDSSKIEIYDLFDEAKKAGLI